MKPKFSIIVPLYGSEENLPYTLPRLLKLADELIDYEIELLFVDDASPDQSAQLILAARQKDSRIKLVRLSKNFGSMLAIMAGVQYATGDCLGVIAADLQDPPELFKEMLLRWQTGDKVVLAVRSDREESVSQKLFAGFYYRLLAKFALPNYPRGGFDFVLFDRQVSSELLAAQEKNTNLMSLIYWLGHQRSTIYYVRQKRQRGHSRWTLAKKLKLVVDSFVSFSYLPIRLISIIGFVTALLSFAYGLFVFIEALLGKIAVQGYSALMTVITFLLGLIMVMLGIIGEYLWRVLDEVRSRPAYVVDQTYL
ncbi:MAG: glycosyltransferase family 2 protein [Patescibacteria group bacterium]